MGKWINGSVVRWLVLAVLASPIVSGRTFELDDSDCERIAVIASDAPRLSWAGYPGESGYGTGALRFGNSDTRKSAFLIAFPIERIPKGMRITSATLSMNCILNYENKHRLQVRRIIGDWGDCSRTVTRLLEIRNIHRLKNILIRH